MLTKLLKVEMERRAQIKEMSLNQSPVDLLINYTMWNERITQG